MDWRRNPGTDPADPNGVADLLVRACELVSTSAVEGTRFVCTTEEMLRVSREIEQASMVRPEDPLYVGVQRGARLDAQYDVYRTLIDAGVQVTAFGCDEGTELPDVRWVRVPEDRSALDASWFLARSGAQPHSLAGFELEADDAGRRRWEGFETRDSRLIDAIIEHLDGVAARAETDVREHSGGYWRR